MSGSNIFFQAPVFTLFLKKHLILFWLMFFPLHCNSYCHSFKLTKKIFYYHGSSVFRKSPYSDGQTRYAKTTRLLYLTIIHPCCQMEEVQASLSTRTQKKRILRRKMVRQWTTMKEEKGSYRTCVVFFFSVWADVGVNGGCLASSSLYLFFKEYSILKCFLAVSRIWFWEKKGILKNRKQ